MTTSGVTQTRFSRWHALSRSNLNFQNILQSWPDGQLFFCSVREIGDFTDEMVDFGFLSLKMGFYGRDGGFWISVLENEVFTDDMVDFGFPSLKMWVFTDGIFCIFVVG